MLRQLLLPFAAAITASFLAPGAALAQNALGIGSAQAGITVQIATAIGKAVSLGTDRQMRPQPLAGTGQYAPRVNAGDLEFGVSNIIEVTYSQNGKGMFEGRANPNLRLAMTLFPTPITYYVPENSDIQSAEDLAGKRVPTGWSSQRLGEYLFEGFFANRGLSYDDVRPVPVTGLRQMWELFGQGQLDFGLGVMNGAVLQEIETKVGGLRYFPLDDSEEAVTRLQEILPGAYVQAVTAEESGEDVNALAYDFVLFTSTEVDDDTVYKVVKAIHEQEAELKNSVAEWAPKMAAEQNVEYHPGAIRYYKEIGVWPN